jgi:hypothetical protein
MLARNENDEEIKVMYSFTMESGPASHAGAAEYFVRSDRPCHNTFCSKSVGNPRQAIVT